VSERVGRQPIGLIAGSGELPLLVARGMRARGFDVRAIGLAGQYDERLRAECDRFRQVGLFRLGSWARQLRRMGVDQAVIVGGVDKAKLMHDPFRLLRRVPDWTTLVVWYRHLRHDRRSSIILAAVAEQLGQSGVTLIDSTTHIPEHLAEARVMSKRRPSESEAKAIRFGWPLFEQTLSLHVGQSMAVREGDVLAVEAAEGTDAMLRRCADLPEHLRGTDEARSGVLVKLAKPGQERRIDLPTIGIDTVHRAADAGLAGIAVEAGAALILDRAEVIAQAARRGIFIHGLAPGEAETAQETEQPR